MTDKANDLPFVPFALPSLGDDEIREVVETLKAGWITTGPRTIQFERAFAEYVGTPHASAVNSCTAGLHIALVAGGVGPEDEVVLPSLTFAATGNVVDQVGARPVFAEVDPSTLNITASTIAEKLTERTRAVIIVHYAGLPCDIAPVRDLCRERGLLLIEDAAHAIGSRYGGKPIGSHGDAVAFSFYANKTMTTGEGGMVTTASAEMVARMETLRLHGMSRDAWKRYSQGGNWRYDIVEAGFKYNMSDINAALGLVQLRRLESFVARREQIASKYRSALSGIAGLGFQATAAEGARHSYHLFVIRADGAAGAPSREAIIAEMTRRNVAFSVHFIPLHTMSHYRDRWRYKAGDLPITEQLGAELLSLPLFPAMSDVQVDRVIDAIRAAYGVPS